MPEYRIVDCGCCAPATGGSATPCSIWSYGIGCDTIGTVGAGAFGWWISPGVFCSHVTKQTLYLVVTQGPDELTALGVIPLCYDGSSGGWDVNQLLDSPICGQTYMHLHLYLSGDMTSYSGHLQSPGGPEPALRVIQCDPLILQGVLSSPSCGGSALVTIMEEPPYPPYCGGGTGTGTGTSS